MTDSLKDAWVTLQNGKRVMAISDLTASQGKTVAHIVNKWGSSPDIDTADISAGVQVIWPVKAATQLYKWIDSPLALTLESTSEDDVAAIGTLTLAAQVNDTETVTIGTKVYTFQTTLIDVDGNVQIGTDANGSIENLIAAINLAAGAGVDYAASMTANDAGVYAVIGVGDTMTLYVNTGTAIATTSIAIGILTLTGQPADTQTVTIASKVYTFQAVLTDVDGNVLIGGSASETIDNLIAAINLGTGAGTLYAAAMTANAAPTSAYQGAGDTMVLHALTAIATTETADNTAWGAANAVLSTTWGAAAAVVGTGAHTVTVNYHDSDGKSQDVVLPLRGSEPVTIAIGYGVFRISVLTSGTGNKNAGQLKVMNSTDIYATVEIGEGQTQIACQRVPNDHSGLITKAHCGYGRLESSTNTAGMRLRIRRTDGTIVTKHDPFIANDRPEDNLIYEKGGITVEAGEWVFWECVSVSANNTPVSARFDLELFAIG